jgi:hypothetical protein
MGFPRELVRLRRGVIPQEHDGAAPLCQSIKCPYTRAGTGVCAREASSEAETDPRARRSLLEGVVSRRAKRSPLEGSVDPRARRGLLKGALDWATPLGRGGRHGVGRALGACISERCFALVFCRF